MRTTLILDDGLVAELLHVTQAKTKTDAIHLAIAELIRRKKIEKLKALSGKLSVTDSAPSQRRGEKKRQALHQRLWHGRR
jgi:hypothetical protein